VSDQEYTEYTETTLCPARIMVVTYKKTLYISDKTMLIFRNYMIFFQTFDNFISYNLFKYFTYVHS